jgi:predicted ATPase
VARPCRKEIADQIIERTDGIPLFIEEMKKAVIESCLLTEADDHYSVTGPIAPLAIPTSLHASLLARLDRLAPVREVAQMAAALGRQFSHELISAVAPMPQEKLDEAQRQLVSTELIFRRGSPPNAECAFATFVRRTTKTVPCTRSSASLNARLDFDGTTPTNNGSASWRWCWLRLPMI